MTCPNCKSETHRITTVNDEDGNPFSFCPQCPRPKVERNFPAIIVRGSRRTSTPEQLELATPETLPVEKAHAAAQAVPSLENVQSYKSHLKKHGLKGNPRDTPALRARDDISNINKKHSVILMGDCKTEKMQAYLNKKMDAKFGTRNWNIVKNDGITITAEQANG